MLNIHCLNGLDFKVNTDMNKDETVKDLKRKISEIRSVDEENFCLGYKGSILNDQRTLLSYNIINNSNIYMVVNKMDPFPIQNGFHGSEISQEKYNEIISDPEKTGNLTTYLLMLVEEEVKKDEELQILINENLELKKTIYQRISEKPEISSNVSNYTLDILNKTEPEKSQIFNYATKLSICLQNPKAMEIFNLFMLHLIKKDPVLNKRLEEHPEKLEEIRMDAMNLPENIPEVMQFLNSLLNMKF